MTKSVDEDIRRTCERVLTIHPSDSDAAIVARYVLDRLGEQGKLTDDERVGLRLAENYLFNEDADELEDQEVFDICWALAKLYDRTSGHSPSKAGEPQGWQPISSAPKNSSELILKVPCKKLGQGYYRQIGHYACDLSGEEQPAFRGFFFWDGHQMREINPTSWMPLPKSPEKADNT